MSYDGLRTLLAATAVLPAGATFYFFIFWRWFDHWRRHQVATYVLVGATFVALGVGAYLLRASLLALAIVPPAWLQAAGWAVLACSSGLGFVADRQIGLRVRSFTPFFEERGRLTLRTSGAYAVVRHPIYASGIGYQLGALLVTGSLPVAIALAIFALGAAWFTRQEEQRLVALLDDPTEYERYRARVPALIPWIRCQP
jgi:protein-S-isoprenylcysteine O-methyltransferase Ste14